jgi:multidrug efflux pump subunit AcrB
MAALAVTRAQFPDVDFKVINTQSTFTAADRHRHAHAARGIFLTGIAMVFFLRSWRKRDRRLRRDSRRRSRSR